MPFYAVAVGRKKGIYMRWCDCRDQIQRFKGAKYKKFDSKEDAESKLIGLPEAFLVKSLDHSPLLQILE